MAASASCFFIAADFTTRVTGDSNHSGVVTGKEITVESRRAGRELVVRSRRDERAASNRCFLELIPSTSEER
jgi:hypothetical protein